MVRKRRHSDPLSGDHTHPLYPQEQPPTGYYGSRDESQGREGECYEYPDLQEWNDARDAEVKGLMRIDRITTEEPRDESRD
jgi:hypothetical protein